MREACRRLAEEGLLAHRPRHGYSAPVIDPTEIEEFYEVRRALEMVTVRRAARPAARGPILASLRRAWSADMPEPGVEIVYRDEAFHLALARISNARVALQMLESINARIRLVRVHDFLDQDRIRATVNQHLAIIDAIEDRDGDDRRRPHRQPHHRVGPGRPGGRRARPGRAVGRGERYRGLVRPRRF